MVIGEGIPAQSVPSPVFDQFVEQCHYLLDTEPVEVACHGIIELLVYLLPDLALIDALIPEPAGRHTIYERFGGLTILGHHHPESVASRPHNHGRTWAIYGVVSGKTAIYEWECIEPNPDWAVDAAIPGGKVKLTRSYWALPGQAFYFPIGAIHSHVTHDDSKLIRIEGMNIKRRRSLNIEGKYFEPIVE